MSFRTQFRFVSLRVLVVLPLLALSACGWLSPYRIDIQQGNVVEARQVSQLRVGLTQEQVRFLLGTPLIADVFHKNRWDYVYRIERRSEGTTENARATLFFGDDGKLARWTAEVPPSPAEARRNQVYELSGGSAAPSQPEGR